MAGLVGYYTSVPRLKKLNSRANIQAVLGLNPINSGPVKLPNVRGQLTFNVTSVDSGYSFSLEIVGGWGETQDAYTQNFYFVTGTEVGCTVTSTIVNTIEVVTPAGDGGGRTYQFVFYPYTSTQYTVEKTAGADLTDDFLVDIIKYVNVIQN